MTRRVVFAAIVMFAALGLVVQFWWPFQVSVRGRTWISAQCYTSNFGWAALGIVTSDPVRRAKRDADAGQFRLMLSPGYGEGKELKQTSFPGVRCSSALEGQFAPGMNTYGDAMTSRCEAFHAALRPCYAASYNHQLIQDINFPLKTSCGSVETQCPYVEAPWNSKSNQR